VSEHARAESHTAPSAETSADQSETSSGRFGSSSSTPRSPIRLDTIMHVDLMACLGDDMSVVNAARVSTTGQQGSQKVATEGLISHLMKNRHGSPFEHNSFTFFVQAPIFVMREFQRHRVGWSYNEQSGRYSELKPHFWVPPFTRELGQDGKPSDYHTVASTLEQQEVAARACLTAYQAAWSSYQDMLDGGIAREVARSVLPVATYSSMYCTCNARSLMHFLSLRTKSNRAIFASNPQAEIQEVALKMEQWFGEQMPNTYKAFNRWGRVAP
jgi:thymidylate synthase (FAD)